MFSVVAKEEEVKEDYVVVGLYSTKYLEYQSICPSSELALPPSPARACVPPLEPKGGGNFRLSVRGRGSQIGRLERKLGTLSTL